MDIHAEDFPGLYRRQLTPGISWRFYKHWGQSYLAGEGLTDIKGDHSGGLRMMGFMRMTTAPSVAQARLYESERGWVSAVYSYPHGIGLVDHYFWEIYTPESDLMEEPERYDTEQEMEQRIREILEPGDFGHMVE